jgi:hypothetical protein
MASFAHVARQKLDTVEFLGRRRRGGVDWVETADQATLFQNVREATRAAMLLPSRERAFALPTIGL